MPYPYTLMPDGHTMEPEDVVKPPPKTQEDSTSTQPPTDGADSTDDAALADDEDSTSGADSTTQETQSNEQSNGQTSSSDSGEQGGSDSSQEEDSNGADRGKDETGAQDELPDFEAGQEDHYIPGLMAGLGLNRLFGLSNPDLIRVQQDMERRPLTFKLCFEQAESPRSALEFIYAEPPDLDDNAMIHLQKYLSQEPDTVSTGWGTTGGREDIGTPDIDTGLLSTVYKIEEHLESEYGYRIDWGEGISNADRLEQLHELAQASEHIVDYLDVVYKDDPNTTGKEAFRKHFSESVDHGQLVIQLGADAYLARNFSNISKEEAGYYGQVPYNETNNMYLGSMVDVPTIVHEFGHVIDRSLSIEDEYTATWGTVFPWPDWIKNVGLPLNADILQYGIVGFAGKQNLTEEFWADLFMTAVLDSVIGGPLYVYSSTHERIRQLSGSEFDHCEDQAGQEDCDRRPVQWVAEEDYAVSGYPAFPKDQFPILLRSLLSG